MLVRDIMSRPVFTVWPTDPVEGAAALLADREIAAVPVVDERNRLVGMVSEVDLLRGRIPADPTWSSSPTTGATFRRIRRRPHIVAEVMTRAIVIADPLQDVADVVRTMLERDVRSVPVLDEGHLVGIVSRRDVLRAVLRPRRGVPAGPDSEGMTRAERRRRGPAAGAQATVGPKGLRGLDHWARP